MAIASQNWRGVSRQESAIAVGPNPQDVQARIEPVFFLLDGIGRFRSHSGIGDQTLKAKINGALIQVGIADVIIEQRSYMTRTTSFKGDSIIYHEIGELQRLYNTVVKFFIQRKYPLVINLLRQIDQIPKAKVVVLPQSMVYQRNLDRFSEFPQICLKA